ncbi:MAG: MMPL family transporter [Thermodesulfobacteriota bacterium]|jgi:predicted RND superfamily exporter protein
MGASSVVSALERLVFARRPLVIGLFAAVTAVMAVSATQLRVDAGFAKLLPLKHEYMQTFLQYRDEFGGANRVLIALMAREGDIYTPQFFDVLREATDEVFFLPGVDRTRVMSLFTPNVRFTEVVEDGISGGNVVPDDFQNTPEDLEQVRRNVLKSNYVGRLVANDFTGAIISAELLEVDPNTGERLDYIGVAALLEEKIRQRFESDAVDVHIIGFAKVIGDITAGARRVVLFFAVTFLITAALVYVYAMRPKLAVPPLICSVVAVVWQLGLLPLLGYGMDPMGILVPFLVFAIGVSHGVQMVSANGAEVYDGADGFTAAKNSFRRLLVPGGIALASDTIGFITIRLIDIQVIQDMAVTASLGVGSIILTNLVLLPVLLSYIHYDDAFREKMRVRSERVNRGWRKLDFVTRRGPAAWILAGTAVLFAFGAWKGSDVKIGDLHRGVPELRAESRYNRDSEVISERFSIGVDILTVIVETVPEGCVDYEVMTTVDRFEWHMRNVEGVQSVVGLPGVARVITSGWNEGSLKWRELSRNKLVLVQSVTYVPTSTGLLNADCSVLPVLVFTEDHKAETIDRVVAAVKEYQAAHGSDRLKFRLAASNVGVMAATNEEVRASQFPILLYVFGAVIALCLVTFRSVRGTLCIVIPLGLVSLLAYALMAALEIGLKVSTLPVVALGVGVGVDYGIYIYSRFRDHLDQGLPIGEAYWMTLRRTGNGVVFTGATLAIGVATWIFSPLKFQADMGVLLTFMFLLNMLGAIVLLPALACWLLPEGKRETGGP